MAAGGAAKGNGPTNCSLVGVENLGPRPSKSRMTETQALNLKAHSPYEKSAALSAGDEAQGSGLCVLTNLRVVRDGTKKMQIIFSSSNSLLQSTMNRSVEFSEAAAIHFTVKLDSRIPVLQARP